MNVIDEITHVCESLCCGLPIRDFYCSIMLVETTARKALLSARISRVVAMHFPRDKLDGRRQKFQSQTRQFHQKS